MSSEISDVTRRESPRFSIVVVLCALVTGALGGFTAAGYRHRHLAGPDSGAPHLSAEAWLARAATSVDRAVSPALRQELVGSLTGDPALRKALTEHYGREARRPYRITIKDMLAASPAPEIATAALDLAGQSDGVARAAGLELLGALEPTAEALALARRALNEADAGVLVGALQALRPLGPPPQGEARAVLPRLIELTRHPDTLVRAHAVQRVADWDKLGDEATSVVLHAISDGDKLVRQAAIGAVMIGQLRSDAVKLALLGIVSDAAEDLTARGASLFALQQFSLTDEEQARYVAVRDELERRAKAP
jgi:hypothetical protein